MATDAPSTGARPCAPITPPVSGLDLHREGERAFPDLYPDPSTHRAASQRLAKRARALLASHDERTRSVGFFLFGMSEKAREKRRA